MSAVLHAVGKLVLWAFLYCCDFMLNLANRTGTTYNETNTWVLLLGLPGLLAGLVRVRVAQRFWLRRLRRERRGEMREPPRRIMQLCGDAWGRGGGPFGQGHEAAFHAAIGLRLRPAVGRAIAVRRLR